MSYNHTYYSADSEAIGAIITVLINLITSGGFALLAYILRSWAVYAIAKRRQLRHPWMAWVPVADLWLLGCISDQYQYVVKGRDKSRRKVLLVLNILTVVLGGVISILAISSAVGILSGLMASVPAAEAFSSLTGLILGTLGLALPLAVAAIALAVFRFMALYDLYASCVPQNATLFIVLSILFQVTEPFFLFFSREKDEGMPPRRPEPVYQPEDPVYAVPVEPWEENL